MPRQNRLKRSVSLAAACAAMGFMLFATSVVEAGVINVDPFLGDDWESFEYIAPPSGGTFPSIPLFSDGPGLPGPATMTNPFANFLILTGTLFNFPNNVELTAYNGNLFSGAPVGQLRITFDSPIQSFGAYLGTAGPSFPTTDPSLFGSAVLFDGAGNSIGTTPIEVPIGDWAWHGWTSDVPFSAVEMTLGQFPPGDALLIDDVVYSVTAIPEPAAALVLVVAGVLLLCWRRAKPSIIRSR